MNCLNGREKFTYVHDIFMCTYWGNNWTSLLIIVVMKMCVKMHGHENGDLLKSRDLISPFCLLEELQMVFLASLLLKIPWPSLLPQMKQVAKSKEWPCLTRIAHYCTLCCLAHFLQPAVLSCIMLKLQVSGTRNFSGCGLFGTFLGPHLYSKNK